jgi:hypothetical protein
MKNIFTLAKFSLILSGISHATTLQTWDFKERYGVSFPDQIISVPYSGPKITPGSTTLLAPNGVDQVPYQLDQAGNLTFRYHLPASTVPARYSGGGSFTSTTLGFPPYEYSFPTNQLVQIGLTGTPGGGCSLTNNGLYYIKNFDKINQALSLSATIGGATLTVTGCAQGGPPTLTYSGFTVDGSHNVIAPGHGFAARDPIQFEGALGANMAADTVYYVCGTVTVNQFHICTDVAGTTDLNPGALSSGLNKIISDWTFTLVSATTPTTAQTRPVTTTAGPGYITIGNGLAAIRINKPTNPTQTWNASNGTPSCVVSGPTPNQTIVCTVAGHGMSGGATISVSGCSSNDFSPCGIWTLDSVTTNTFTFTKLLNVLGVFVHFTGFQVQNGTYNTSTDPNLTIINADLSMDPLQGMQLATGQWVGTGSRLYMSSTSGATSGRGIGPVSGIVDAVIVLPFVTNYKLFIVDSGPLKTTVQVSLTVNRPLYTAGGNTITGATASTSAQYLMTFTVFANQSDFLVDIDEGGINLGHLYNLYAAWPSAKPDMRQFRTAGIAIGGGCLWPNAGGYYSGPLTATNVASGSPTLVTIPNHGLLNYGQGTISIGGVTGSGTIANINGNGQTYTVVDANTISIATSTTGTYSSGGFVRINGLNQGSSITYAEDLSYSGAVYVGSCSAGVSRSELSTWGNANIGGQWQAIFNNASAPSTDPMFAVYSGKAGVQINGPSSGVGFQSSNSQFNTGSADIGLWWDDKPCYSNTFGGNCGAQNPTFAPNNHRQIGIMLGTKADLNVGRVQSANKVNLAQNNSTGINLSEIYSYNLGTFPDPVGGFKNPFIPDSSITTISGNYQANIGGFKGLADHTVAVTGDNYSTPILACWAAPSSACIDAALATVPTITQDAMIGIVNNDGVQDERYFADQLVLFANPLIMDAANYLATPYITATQKTTLKTYVALLGSLIVDTNFRPTFVGYSCVCGDGTETANQTLNYASSINKAATLYPTQPYIAAFSAQALSTSTVSLYNTINSYGTGQSSPNYLGTYDQQFWTLLAEKKLGGADLSGLTRLPKYVKFLNNFLTPPEPRFGNVRLFPATGESTYVTIQSPGLLTTLLSGADATDACGGWNAQNTPVIQNMNPFFGPAYIGVDQAACTNAAALPSLTTANFPGYYTASRFGQGTANETWCLILNGDFYGDHAHADRGSPVCWALNGPLLGDFSSNIYQPDSPGRFMHNSLVYNSELTTSTQNAPYSWNGSPTSLYDPETTGGSTSFGVSAQTEVIGFGSSSIAAQTFSNPDGTVWTRTQVMTAGNAAFPQIFYKDKFSGTNATVAKTITWNMMYDGNAVTTPAGSITPTLAHTVCVGEAPNGPPSPNFPSGGTANNLGAGLQGFSFRGWNTPAMTGGGINSDFYLLRSSSSGQYAFGSFAHQCEGTIQNNQYQTANTLTPISIALVDSSHLKFTFAANSHNYQIGDEASISGVTGAGAPNISSGCNWANNTGAWVTAVSGNDVTFTNAFGATLSGSYSGGSVVPCFRERFALLRYTDTGSFTTLFQPWNKGSAPTKTVTSQTCGIQTVTTSPVSSTECISETEYTYVSSSKNVLSSYDSASHSAFSLTISGGPAECALSATTGTCYFSGMTPGTRTITLPVGFTVTSGAVGRSGGNYTLYYPGGSTPTTTSFTFSTTPVARRSVPFSFTPPSGTSTVRIKAGSAYALSVACSSACSASVELPTTPQSVSWEFVDGAGNVLFASNPQLVGQVP